MIKEIDPKETKRAAAFELWMDAPMPMTTYLKTLDVTNLIKVKTRLKCKFNMLLCWCIGKAASQMEEFYLLPVKRGEDAFMAKYDQLAVNVLVRALDGSICSCDVPFSYELVQFNRDYMTITRHTQNIGKPYSPDADFMVVNTAALVGTELDGVISMYAGTRNNPNLFWGKFRKRIFKTTLPLSFQFHRTQMDGFHAAMFLDLLQSEINKLGKPTPQPAAPPAPTTEE